MQSLTQGSVLSSVALIDQNQLLTDLQVVSLNQGLVWYEGLTDLRIDQDSLDGLQNKHGCAALLYRYAVCSQTLLGQRI